MRKVIYRGAPLRFALMVTLTAIGLGCSAIASAAPAGETGAGYRASEWATSTDPGASGSGPALHNGIETPVGGGSQLRAGLCLVGLGLLTLALGMTVAAREPRRGQARGGPRPATWPRATLPPTGTRARP